MLNRFNEKEDITEKSSDLFLDSARNQYFFDGNKRTAQLIMNGFLMSNGLFPRSITTNDIEEYNQKMTDFYNTNDKKEMYAFWQKVSSNQRYII